MNYLLVLALLSVAVYSAHAACDGGFEHDGTCYWSPNSETFSKANAELECNVLDGQLAHIQGVEEFVKARDWAAGLLAENGHPLQGKPYVGFWLSQTYNYEEQKTYYVTDPVTSTKLSDHDDANMWYSGQPCETKNTVDVILVLRPAATETEDNRGFYTWKDSTPWNVLCMKTLK